MTALDKAHAAMQAIGDAPRDGAARLRFYDQLADTELFVLLDREAKGEAISPELFEIEEGRFVLAFDLEERMVDFTGRAAPYAALSGRVLAQMLDGQEIGLGVNLGVAPSSILVPAVAIGWLNRTLGEMPIQIETRIAGFHPPSDLPEALIVALNAKLARSAGLAQAAFLTGVTLEGGGRSHLLGFVGADERAQYALAKAAGEALTFAGIDEAGMDVGFFAVDDPVVARLVANGLAIDLPQPPPKPAPLRAAPGSNPDKPPILK